MALIVLRFSSICAILSKNQAPVAEGRPSPSSLSILFVAGYVITPSARRRRDTAVPVNVNLTLIGSENLVFGRHLGETQHPPCRYVCPITLPSKSKSLHNLAHC